MQFIRKISIRARMNAAMVFTAAIMVALGGGGYLAVSRAQSDFSVFAQQHLPLVVTVNQAREALAQLARFDETDVVMNYSMPSEAQRHTENWQALLANARAPLLRAGVPADPAHAKALENAAKALQLYEQRVAPVFKTTSEGQLRSVVEGKRMLEGVKRGVTDTEEALGKLAQQLDAATKTMTTDIAARNQRSSKALAIIVPVALLILLPLMWLTLRSIVVPLLQARAVASRIAQGELSVQVQDSGRDEPAELLRSLADMQAGLRTLVGGIREAASFVSTASHEIAAGNKDLSHRTETTASGLEAASNGMTHLSEQLNDSARSAGEAQRLAVQAEKATAQGGAAVTEAVRMMESIAQSSSRIAEIVDVVDRIAQRTHILALNAGVEAARAGDLGRGFGVVALEVRTLAQGVADSAREIRTLIQRSVEHVSEGAVRVRQAGDTMEGVIDSARSVSNVVQGIASSVTQQSKEMTRVNDAVSELDRLTQQNSALVEQSAAAAEGLREQAQRLETLVGAFKIA